MRKLLALVLAAALLALTACGAGTPKTVGAAEPLSSLELTPGADDNTAPTVKFDTPLTATAAGAKVIKEGDGPEITEGQNVTYKMSGYNTADGTELGNTFTQPGMTLSVVEELKKQDPEIFNILVGTKVGSWVAYVRPTPAAEAAPSTDAKESGSAEPSEPAKAEQLLVLKITGAEDIPEPARTLGQDEVKKLADDGALPTVEFGKDGNPTIAIPKDKPQPEGLVVQVLKEGKGETVTETSTITADYEGVRWEDGKVFDSSYDRGEPASFPLTGVIKGWTQGLAGQKAGSRVLLTIPGSLAYDGSQGPQGTLVFVVDIKSVKASK